MPKSLLAEIAEEEGLDEDELEAALELVRRRKQRSSLAKRTPDPGPKVEFPAGPNHARAIERREASRLAVGNAHLRGVQMYGHETPDEAYERWREQEENDVEGVYGPGGGSAGGIFGDGPVHMPDYDPSAHARSAAADAASVNVKLARVLERVLQRLDAADEREARAALPRAARGRLTGKRG